jgi:hypothetical protein
MTEKIATFPADHISATAPANSAKALTLEDHTFELGATLYVGGAGDITGRPLHNARDAEEVEFLNVSGASCPVRWRSINFAACTATNIVAIW